MNEELPPVPQLHPYEAGVPVVDRSRGKPLIRAITARLMKKALSRGIAAQQTVKLKHKKKVKYY